VRGYSLTGAGYGPAMTFARQGYSATSVADIQQACGLSPGSGALYKHFPSKKALLQEATRRHVEQPNARKTVGQPERVANQHRAW
jgi:AcrR family transcriptional regulator